MAVVIRETRAYVSATVICRLALPSTYDYTTKINDNNSFAYFPMELVSRTVHVKIYPTARTFSERTEVLRVLEKFGQVDYFRSLKVSFLRRKPINVEALLSDN